MKEQKNYHQTFCSFVNKGLIYDQTALVNHLIETDSEGIIQDDRELMNYSRYRADLSDGVFFGTYDELTQRRIKVEEELEILQNEGNKSRSGNPSLPIKGEVLIGEINRLESDLDKLENPEYLAKEVFEWWLIPYWLSEKLRKKEEVILQACHCYWWGRTQFTPIEDDEVINGICEELGAKSIDKDDITDMTK
jgi:hypothetical protein